MNLPAHVNLEGARARPAAARVAELNDQLRRAETTSPGSVS
jgi:hypothetical protein